MDTKKIEYTNIPDNFDLKEYIIKLQNKYIIYNIYYIFILYNKYE